MSFGVFMAIWWLIGYIGIVVLVPKKHDVTWGELVCLFPFFALGGAVLVMIILAETYGNKIAIKRRD